MKFKPGDLVEMRLYTDPSLPFAGVGIVEEVGIFSCLVEWLKLPLPSFKKHMLVEERFLREF